MIKKIIISLILSAMTLGLSVSAAENAEVKRFFGDNGEVEFIKEIPAETSFVVVKGNKDWASIKNDTVFLNANTVFYEYVLNNTKKKYEFDFILESQGIYSAFTGTDKTLIAYADKTENETALQALKQSDSAGFGQMLDNKYNSLASSTDLYTADNDDAAAILYNYISGKSVPDRTEFAESFDKAYLMAGINNGQVSDLSEYLYSAGILGKSAAKYFKTEYTADIFAAVKGKTTIDDFDYAVISKLILSTVSKSGDVSLIKSAFTEYADKIGLNTAYITDSAMTKINKVDYANIDALKSALEGYYNAGTTSKPPSNSPTGGGGGDYVSPSDKAAANTVGGVEIEVNNSGNNTTVSIFDDISGYEWAREAIEELYKKGIVSGKTISGFFPEDKVMREEFITMLILATKLNVVADDIAFVDVPKSKWFYEYVNRGYKAGIVSGISEEYFGTGEPITRQDIAVMVYNVLNVCGVPLEAASDSAYIDEDNISGYAKTAVHYLTANGIFNGYDDNSFKPLNNASRAEAAVVVYNMVKLMQAHKEV